MSDFSSFTHVFVGKITVIFQVCFNRNFHAMTRNMTIFQSAASVQVFVNRDSGFLALTEGCLSQATLPQVLHTMSWVHREEKCLLFLFPLPSKHL